MGGNALLSMELEVEILLKLSVKSLFKFKSVCMKWSDLIRSPSFITRYTNMCNGRNTGKLLCFRKNRDDRAHVISLFDDQTFKKITDLEWPTFIDEGVKNKEEFPRGINILGPVNGIYCIFNRLIERWIGTLVLWNPTTREYKHILPRASLPFASQLVAGFWNSNDDYDMKRPVSLDIGFGLDGKTNDLKVVVISHWGQDDGPDDFRWHVRTYNLSHNSWRTIYYLDAFNDKLLPFQGLSPPFPHIESFPQYTHCHLNGVFHWSCITSSTVAQSYYDILAFDMSAESFQLIKGPPIGQDFYDLRTMWVLRGTIAVTGSSFDNLGSFSGVVDLWMMMEYGVENSWTMINSFGPITGLNPVAIPNDNQIFFRDGSGQLISCGIHDNKVKEHGIYGLREDICHPSIHECLGVLQYVETLVSLNLIFQDR